MKNKILGSFLFCTMVLSSVNSVFAENINVRNSSKNTPTLDRAYGLVDMENIKKTKIEDERVGAVSKTNVTVNIPQIKDSKGKVNIRSDNDTEYKKVKTWVIADTDIDINVPIIYGSETDVDIDIENNSKTSYENVEAKYIFDHDYTYNKPIYINFGKKE